MHCTLTYDLGATGDRRTQIEAEIDKILKPYRWAKRLTTFYVVEIDSKENWDKLLTDLQNLSKSISERFHFIMSPPMTGGRYNGILPSGKWDFINEITSKG